VKADRLKYAIAAVLVLAMLFEAAPHGYDASHGWAPATSAEEVAEDSLLESPEESLDDSAAEVFWGTPSLALIGLTEFGASARLQTAPPISELYLHLNALLI